MMDTWFFVEECQPDLTTSRNIEELELTNSVDWYIFPECDDHYACVVHKCTTWAFVQREDGDEDYCRWRCSSCKLSVPESVRTVAELMLLL